MSDLHHEIDRLSDVGAILRLRRRGDGLLEVVVIEPLWYFRV
jgi:hypothetical protein